MASQPPYMVVGQPQNAQYGQPQPSYRNLPFNLSDHQNLASTSTANIGITPGANSSLPQSSFRAPAHKHAHHLHSIPPREKSTRTLIIDHMLWVHGRTRIAQARAELGLTDRTGGPTSPNYVHRTRPESYEEEDEDGSEGEDVVALRARAGGPGHPHNDDEEERMRRQDLALARTLRLRAEGLEKVVTSMLEQPPPIHPINDETILTPPTSPKLNASSATHPHRLPNGVRLRLALGTIVNDLFARQAPPAPHRHTHPPNPNTRVATPSDQSPSVAPTLSELPDALTTLAPVSGAFAPIPSSPHRHRSQYTPTYHSGYSQPASSRMNVQYPSLHSHSQSQRPPSPATSRPRASSRTRSLYSIGADPSTANAPPAFRCPRHLHTGCEICVEAKSPSRQSGSSNSRGRSTSFANSASSNSWRGMPGGVGPGGGGITGWQDGTGIGSGLLRPGVRGSALRRKVLEGDSTHGAGNTKLSKLIPRFIRLSALVAAELGREARGEDEASEDGRGDREGSVAAASAATPSGNVSTPGRSESAGWSGSGAGGGFSPLPPPASPIVPRASQATQARNRMYEYALRPSLEWYMLLSGLLTRAVLEGYLTAGWSGLQPVQCLLLVGLGINEDAKRRRDGDEYGDDEEDEEDEDEEFAGLDPDELPNLTDAVRILFPSLRDGLSGVKDQAEEEYGVEMLERLKRFYDIPPSTPDCSTHMEDLAWQFPAEPVERAAVRFCEAIAKWRGKPELETYKKKPLAPPDPPTSPGGSAPMTIESLVHSNPTSPTMGNSGVQGMGRSRRRLKKPSIDVFFIQAQPQSQQVTPTHQPRPTQPQQTSPRQVSPMQRPRQPPLPPQQQQQQQTYQQQSQSQQQLPPQHRRGDSENDSWGRNSNNKRYRDADDGGRPDASKRMFP